MLMWIIIPHECDLEMDLLDTGNWGYCQYNDDNDLPTSEPLFIQHATSEPLVFAGN